MKRAKQHIAFLVLSWTLCLAANAQTFEIPDPIFKSYLLSRVPEAFNGQDELILDSAAVNPKSIQPRYLGIKNIDGIQYFTSTTDIDLTGNLLNSLPDLHNTTQLFALKLDSNNFEVLPPMNSFAKLENFKCDSNYLTSLPDLSNNPDLNRVFCRMNRIEALPEFTGCLKLDKVICTFNQLTTVPDFSEAPLFSRLICHNNPITSLPDFSSHPTFSSIICIQTQLTFDDLLLLAQHPSFSPATFDYAPFDSIVVPNQFSALNNETLTINLGIDDTVTTNTYYWFRNGIAFDTTTSNTLELVNPDTSLSGTFMCSIENSTATYAGEVMHTTSIVVEIEPCVDASGLNIESFEVDCKKGTQLSIDTTTLKNFTAPLQMAWINSLTTDTLWTSDINDHIPWGRHRLMIEDATGCRSKATDEIEILNPPECAHVLTPDGDGENDSFFFDMDGEVQILDTRGQVVHQFSAPYSWDASSSQGTPLPMGLYSAIVNGNERILITIVK